MLLAKNIRVATWNLDHAYNNSRPIPLQISRIREINPDIIILTETTAEVSLEDIGYQGAYPEHKNKYGKFCSAIWSKFPIEFVFPIEEKMLAVAALIGTPLGPVVVYGTIIPYHGYKGPNGISPAWQEHYKSITRQAIDWARILELTAHKIPLVVAGDFNQTRDGSHRTYGTDQGRLQLSSVLKQNNMHCLTEENFALSGKLNTDPAKGKARNNIDHICLYQCHLQPEYIGAWDHFTNDGVYLSDHNGVFVDLMLQNV